MISLIKKYIFLCSFYVRHPTAFFKLARQYSSVQPLNYKISQKATDRVSIIIVTFNALDYIRTCLNSIQKFRPKNYEVVVVDNGSSAEVVNFLQAAKDQGFIGKLHLAESNHYFSGGNNIGAKLSDPRSKYLLLLNSDVEIRDSRWCDLLLSNAPERGMISYGKTDVPTTRPDGWCLLIDRQTYLETGGINEYYQMNWGITELTGKIGKRGYPVFSIINPEQFILHFGQKSYNRKAKQTQFNAMTFREVLDLFKTVKVSLIKA